MSHATALLALHAAVVLFGFAGLFGKWLALPPVLIVLGRTAIAAAALFVVLVRRQDRAPFDARLGVNGVVLAVHWWSFFAAIQASSVSIGLLGYASFPLFTLLFERALLARRWTGREGATALLVAVGLVSLVPEPSIANPTVRGLGWGIVSGATFALLAVLNRRWSASHAATNIAFWQNLIAALVLLPFAWGSASGFMAIGMREVLLLLALGLLCTAAAHTMFIASFKAVTAHTASVVAALEPVYGIALAVVLLGEALDGRTLAGGALLVTAAILATRGSVATVGGGQSIG